MNCDQIARWYRWMEYAGFGRALERRRLAFLDQISDTKRVLVLGDGDGRFVAKLAEKRPQNSPQNRGKNPQICRKKIDYLDLSPRMLEIARNRAGTGQICYRQGDALTIPLARAEYDLVVTHFFLDCFDARELTLLIERVTQSLKPKGRWLISEFREPGWWARAMVSVLYAFFRVTTGLRTRRLIDHRPLLARRGFVLLREETGRFGLLASELWRFEDNGSK